MNHVFYIIKRYTNFLCGLFEKTTIILSYNNYNFLGNHYQINLTIILVLMLEVKGENV